MSAPRGAARVVVWAASTVTTLVLLLSYPTSDGSWLDGGGTAVVAGGDAGTAPAAQPSSTTTYDGAAVQTRWGTVQVQVMVTDGVVADVVALQLPSENGRDREISARAEPLLRQEARGRQRRHRRGHRGHRHLAGVHRLAPVGPRPAGLPA